MRKRIRQTITVMMLTLLTIILFACNGQSTVTVTFNAGSGATVSQEQVRVTKGSLIEEPTATKAGYSLNGWYLEEEFSNKWDFDQFVVVADITLYAKWDVIVVADVYHAVTFQTNGGSSIPSMQVLNNTAITLPAAPTKNGYNFAGWYIDEALTIKFSVSQVFTKNTTLYAKWNEDGGSIGKIYVSFSGIGVSIAKVEVINGRITMPSNPSREGYTFAGWYLESTFTNQFTNQNVDSSITVYAKWIDSTTPINEFDVIFNSNGGSAVELQSVIEGTLATKPKNPTKGGYTFEYWALNGNEFNFATPITDNIELVAVWKLIVVEDNQPTPVYEHNFSTDGVAGDLLSFNDSDDLEFKFVVDKYGVHEYEGTTYSLGYKINSEGFIQFTTTQANLKLVLYVAMRDGVASSIKVNTTSLSVTNPFNVFEVPLTEAGTYKIDRFDNKAKECGILFLGIYTTETSEPTVSVTFDSKGGSLVPSQTVIIGSAIEHPEEYPVNGEMDFGGWYLDSECTILYDFDEPVLKNITLYAKWSMLETHIITYNGVEYPVKHGREFPNISYDVPAGKIFVGWEANGELVNTSLPVTSSFSVTAKFRDVVVYTIEFESNGGNAVSQLSFAENVKVVMPPNPTKIGYIFIGWYVDSQLSKVFDSSKYLTADIRLYAKWFDENSANFNVKSGAYYEAIWATWEDSNPENAIVHYSEAGKNNWIKVDSHLVRNNPNGNGGRVDIVGLKEGFYDIKITSSMTVVLEVFAQFTEAHDRSGYAHFNYTEGIGAYKDDGTLKDNAVVVYVTEENKDSVTIPGITQVGLGWILNNAQYSKLESTTYGLYPSSETLAAYNRPIVFRLIGKITVPKGATGYNSLVNGGTKGDNGNMVRMKDANNITIEGIGEDTEIYGWGIHFMSSVAGRGVGFEVRNVSFRDVPEDAVGMEGVQAGGKLTAPVQRGWIHNNTFYAGFCANPAESDKKEGDGSLDTKRGEYFTISYNRFDGAHKTNLVGASDDNLTFHLTFHHNIWINCASRVPLARKANIHMYNNVFEVTDDNKNEVSYAQNTRANAYIFSEANYFSGVKSPSDVRSGAIKSYNDIRYSTFNEDGATIVTSRTQAVSSGNQFENFDTNSSTFYYDSVNQRSNVKHLTDAVTARAEVNVYAGTYRIYETPDIDNHKITDQAPVVVEESQTFPGGKINKGATFLVFKILVDAEVELSSSSSVLAVLVSIYGERIITGSGKANITAGTYVIESAISHGASKGTSNAKEATVTSFSIKVDDGAASEARIQATEDAINAIPTTVDYSQATYSKILAAKDLFDILKADEKLLVNGAKIDNALASYKTAGKTHIEGLINQIGTVNENSLTAITNARSAYDNAIADIKGLVTNYATLTAAEQAFEGFHVTSVINLINGLVATDAVNLNKADVAEALSDYEFAIEAYNGLTTAQKAQVTNSAKLITGLAKLQEMAKPFEIIDIIDSIIIADITSKNAESLIYAYNTYQALSSELKAVVDETRVTKLNNAWAKYQEEANKITEQLFYLNDTKEAVCDNKYFTLQDCSGGNIDIVIPGFNITVKRGLKLESKTALTFTTTAETSVLHIYFTSGKNININGTTHTVSGTDFKIQLPAGTYTLGKKDSGVIGYILVTEGATL